MTYYGGDYYPEQWPREVWAEDVRLMHEAGVNLVTVGVFAWSFLEPAEGRFDWAWLDEVLDLLHTAGIGVDLATATASPPPWATAAYPRMLPQDANGTTYWPGSRQAYAPSSPDYRRLAARLVSGLAERYAQHPAVRLWHVNNEYGCHVPYDYSDNARDAFRAWLRRTYPSIDELNVAWGTAFWSQRYADFDEILPPRTAPTSINPAQVLDFRRFTSDTLLELFVMERDIIRAAGATQPVTTNFMGAFLSNDYARWAQEVDVVSDDHYADPNDPEAFRTAAFTRDLLRGLKPGTPWLLMEQSSNAVNWRPANASRPPGQLGALSAQALGRGADGVLFFQWRQSRSGSEKFHSAMLPQAGTQTRTWGEVAHLGSRIAGLPRLPVAGHARVALVFDWENWWALENPDHPVVLDYLEIVRRWYAALHRQHIAVDIIRPSAALEGYRVVILPHQYLLRQADADNVSAFVRSGGDLLVTAFSDVVDEHDAFREGGFTVTLRDVLGLQVEDFGALVPPALSAAGAIGVTKVAVGGANAAATGDRAGLPGFGGEYFQECVRVIDAEVVARFEDGLQAGDPAVLSKRSGAGRAHYIATIPDNAGMAAVTQWVLAQAGVAATVSGLDEWTEAAERAGVITLVHHAASDVEVKITGRDLETGREVDRVRLSGFDWKMLDVGGRG